MKKIYSPFKVIRTALVLGLGLCIVPGAAQITQTITFNYTGSMQSFTVPSCVGSVTITAAGGQGVGTTSPYVWLPGNGGWAKGTMTVTAGDVLNVFVGGTTSYNGGGAGIFGNGGGGTDVRLNGIAISDRVIVAGGGGGAGGDSWQCNVGAGDGGGGTAVGLNCVGGGGGAGYTSGTGCGTNGANVGGIGGSGTHGGGGGGGGYTSGGQGASSTVPGTAGTGSLGLGGACFLAPGCSGNGTGGGGGGYWGGGGAAGNNCGAGRGGGGSSWTGSLTAPSFTAGTRTGNGIVVMVYSFNGNGVASQATPTAICLGNSATLSATGMNSYTWSTGSQASSIVVTPITNTSYTVQGTNSVNCVSSSVLNVTVSPSLPVLSVNTSTNITCLGKTVTLTASGALTYTWTGGVTNGLTYSPTVTQAYTVTGGNGCGTTTAVTTVTVAPLPITAASSPTLICAGKAATLTASGPATGFTWTPFPAVLAGTLVIVNPSLTTLYTVTATDGTCAGTATVLLTANPVPTVGISANSTLVCEGYPVVITATGGVTYTWSPGNLPGNVVTVNPTAPSLYTVVASNALGCTSQTTQIVLTSASPTITIAANNTFVCAGAAVNIIATGGNGYAWSNGPTTSSITVNPLVTTSYTVVGTGQNNTCTATKSITIEVFIPGVSATGAATVCNGGGATLTAVGADSYLWDNGSIANVLVVTPSVNTTYTVTTMTQSNNVTCPVVKTIPVLVNPKPNVTAAATNTNICKNENSLLTASGALSYTWTAPSGAVTSTTSIVITPTLPVLYTYSVSGTDANGCINTAVVQVNVKACLGINETASSLNQLFIYPNPNTGEFTVESASEINLAIVNELGQTVRVLSLSNSNSNKILVKDLANGVYFVKGQNSGGIINQRIVVNK